MKHLWLAVLGAALLSGCSTLNKSECITADWYGIGFEDGASGHDVARVSKHRSACARHDVTPNIEAYRDGYDAGILEFCTPQKGYSKGQSGYSYTGVCPAHLEDEFLEAYNDGKELYTIKSKIRSLRDEISSNESRVSEIEKEVQVLEKKAINELTLEEDRKKYINQISGLQQEKGELLGTNDQLQMRINKLELNLLDLQQYLNSKY